MADINVERKKKHIWPWILGLLALLLVIWAMSRMNDNDTTAAYDAPSTAATAPATEPVPADAATAADTGATTTGGADDTDATDDTTPPPP